VISGVEKTNTPRVRPRFELEIACDPDRLMEGLRDRLPNCPNCTGVSVGRHAELFVPEAVRRLWSPWLSVTADHQDGGAVLRGRFAPHPNVWTFYLFLAFGLGFALLVGTTWGYAQWATETTPWALIAVPLVMVFGVALYVASQLGQRLGAEQMTQLRAALEELI
jgi:hypothetical protein